MANWGSNISINRTPNLWFRLLVAGLMILPIGEQGVAEAKSEKKDQSVDAGFLADQIYVSYATDSEDLGEEIHIALPMGYSYSLSGSVTFLSALTADLDSLPLVFRELTGSYYFPTLDSSLFHFYSVEFPEEISQHVFSGETGYIDLQIEKWFEDQQLTQSPGMNKIVWDYAIEGEILFNCLPPYCQGVFVGNTFDTPMEEAASNNLAQNEFGIGAGGCAMTSGGSGSGGHVWALILLSLVFLRMRKACFSEASDLSK